MDSRLGNGTPRDKACPGGVEPSSFKIAQAARQKTGGIGAGGKRGRFVF
ncbi:MAG: hypothetical protein JO166_03365 [Deltaproteobacteria bacterium]|nr:hypothetical protein [Deltaproteobacteria bacterium]